MNAITKTTSAAVLVALGLTLTTWAAEPASGSSFRSAPKGEFDGLYAKRGTWQETIRTVREAMFARELAWNATAMEQVNRVPGVTLNSWWRLGPLPVPEGDCAVDTPLAPEQEWALAKPVGESKWIEASDLKDGLDIRVPLPVAEEVVAGFKALQPPAGFVPAEGAPVVKLDLDKSSKEWLITDSLKFAIQNDPMVELGGLDKLTPKPGDKVPLDGTELTFNPIAPEHVAANGGISLRGGLRPAKANITLLAYHVLDVAEQTNVRVAAGFTAATRIQVVVANTPVKHKQVLELAPGKYPVLVVLRMTANWDRIEPRFETVTPEHVALAKGMQADLDKHEAERVKLQAAGGGERPVLRKASSGRIMYFCRTITAVEPAHVVVMFRWGGRDGKKGGYDRSVWQGMVAWLNGEKVFRQERGIAFSTHDHNVKLHLKKGENRLLVKVLGGGAGFSFGFRCLGPAEVVSGMEAVADAGYPGVQGLGPGDKIDWRITPKPAAENYLNPLWNRIRADFTRSAERRQIDWERRDAIWDRPWPAGSVRELAQRYAARCDGSLRTEAQKLADAAGKPADLGAVRQFYYSAKRLAEAPAPAAFESLRLAVEDLMLTFGPRYRNGGERLARIKSLSKDLAERLPDARRGDPEARAAYDAAFEQFADLRQEALLANPLLAFDKLLLVKRFTGYAVADFHNCNEPGQPLNWQANCSMPSHGYDNEIAVLSPVRPDGRMSTLHRPADMAYVGDVDLDWDADRLLFSSVNSRNRWQVFEIGADGKGLRQVTRDDPPDVDNSDACYLPDRRIVFTSTLPFQGVICTGGSDNTALLCSINADGSGLRRLCFDQEQNWHPSVSGDGRVLYTRWEYADFNHTIGRLLFTMNPDGTGQRSIYKSNSNFPPGLFFPRSVPGHPTKIVAIANGHHGGRRKGYLTVLDPGNSHYEAEGITHMLPPGRNGKIDTGGGEVYNADRYPAFLSPWPLSEKYYLVACRPAWDRPWGIYLVDVFDNMLLLHEDAEYALYEPVPLAKRRRPPVIPNRVDPARQDAEVYLADIYRGPGLAGVPRGAVKALRLYALDYGYRDHVAFLDQGTFDVRRILGTVPVEADGSAAFRVPANTPISFQPLDEQGCAMQLMRSWYTAMPGERIGCVGCHERAQETLRPTVATAFRKPPAEIQPWRGPARGFSFAREVLPVLKRHCAGCHNGKDAPDILSASALGRHLSRPAKESNYHLIPPGMYHADNSKLIHMLRKGHHGVKPDPELLDRIVTWNDLGGPTHASWKEHGKGMIPYNQETRRLETLRQFGCVGLAEVPLPPVGNSPVQPFVPKVEAASPAATVTCPDWPFDKDEAVRRQKAAATVMARSITIGTDVKGKTIALDMVLIPAGEFVMGSTNGFKDELPATRVRVDRPFWISRRKISKEQFQQFDPGVPDFSWDQATAFCRWLSQHTGQKFSLPTEAQWEYACRAGSAEPRGSRGPNAWGLIDMLGSAAEWTLSLYRPYPYADNDGRNDPNAASLRVIRGGLLFGHPTTSSARWGFSQWLRRGGFRVVCEDDTQPEGRKPSP